MCVYLNNIYSIDDIEYSTLSSSKMIMVLKVKLDFKLPMLFLKIIISNTRMFKRNVWSHQRW